MLDSSKLKKLADDNFKFDENGRKLSKPVENTVGKGEIAHCEQFLLFPQCFQKACFSGASKGVVWEWVKNPEKKTSWGKGKNACNLIQVLLMTQGGSLLCLVHIDPWHS